MNSTPANIPRVKATARPQAQPASPTVQPELDLQQIAVWDQQSGSATMRWPDLFAFVRAMDHVNDIPNHARGMIFQFYMPHWEGDPDVLFSTAVQDPDVYQEMAEMYFTNGQLDQQVWYHLLLAAELEDWDWIQLEKVLDTDFAERTYNPEHREDSSRNRYVWAYLLEAADRAWEKTEMSWAWT